MKRISWIMPVAAVLGLSLALSACKDDPAPAMDGGQRAEGQVAGGTISDAMLPLATVRSGTAQSASATRGDDAGAAEGASAARNGAEAGDTAADESGASEDDGAAEPAGENPASAGQEAE